ncbi:hypothetical protein GCM10011487_69210 [Steroidobacter agaridevorans]|uniref:Nuclear transport factor 2 family protein n=1 Tax=Steroidobacter agaridevorans TaxID=2695856 RepID=A0A829YPJ3_9GAMM|nr:nuclear transport factor 2 family protein [Steroidobacter agaridevorans]GFE84921.1 hypothetical protein GCM10011487_69210 [Steroidobacter agaridevorans]
MDTDVCTLADLAKTYFDAAYEMDADKFASIFHPACSVTKLGEDGNVSVTPIETWLAGVRSLQAPKLQGLSRHDELLSIDVEKGLALLKLKLQVPPRYFTDMLSCLRVDGAWKIVQKVTAIERRATLGLGLDEQIAVKGSDAPENLRYSHP